MDILGKTSHTIKGGDFLFLRNTVFPYPPFETYTYSAPSAKITKKLEVMSLAEGASTNEIIEFRFSEGTHNIKINKLEGKGDFKIERIYEIKIIKDM